MVKLWTVLIGGLCFIIASLLLAVAEDFPTLFVAQLQSGSQIATTGVPTTTSTALQTPLTSTTPGTVPTAIASLTATITVTASVTGTVTGTVTVTVSAGTTTPTSTSTLTVTPESTPGATEEPTPAPTETETPTATTIGTATATSTPTSTPSNSPTATPSPTPSNTTTPTATPTITPTATRNLAAQLSISAGSFQMGCSQSEYCDPNSETLGFPEELPLHEVTLDAYTIDQYEVTNARYATCVMAGACTPPAVFDSATRADYYTNPAFAEYPVIHVSWEQAFDFCAWEGKRLPTEAEWERVARGNQGVREFPGGNTVPGCPNANYWGNFPALCIGDTVAVGSYPAGASPDGALDMGGNVNEWVSDWYDPDYYASSPPHNPPGPPTGDLRIYRGGGWNDQENEIRVARRRAESPTYTANNLGFRCVATP